MPEDAIAIAESRSREPTKERGVEIRKHNSAKLGARRSGHGRRLV
jgi:hypothetical protein